MAHRYKDYFLGLILPGVRHLTIQDTYSHAIEVSRLLIWAGHYGMVTIGH